MSRQLPTRSNQGVPGSRPRSSKATNAPVLTRASRAGRPVVRWEPDGPERQPTGPSHRASVRPRLARPTWIVSWSMSACLPAVASDEGDPVVASVCDAMSIEWPKFARGRALDSSCVTPSC